MNGTVSIDINISNVAYFVSEIFGRELTEANVIATLESFDFKEFEQVAYEVVKTVCKGRDGYLDKKMALAFLSDSRIKFVLGCGKISNTPHNMQRREQALEGLLSTIERAAMVVDQRMERKRLRVHTQQMSELILAGGR